jgi:hypothetical protein
LRQPALQFVQFVFLVLLLAHNIKLSQKSLSALWKCKVCLCTPKTSAKEASPSQAMLYVFAISLRY